VVPVDGAAFAAFAEDDPGTISGGVAADDRVSWPARLVVVGVKMSAASDYLLDRLDHAARRTDW